MKPWGSRGRSGSGVGVDVVRKMGEEGGGGGLESAWRGVLVA